MLNSAETVLGHVKHHPKDWFDDNDTEIRALLVERARTQIDHRRNINRWTEHFTQLFSETSTVSDTVINSLPQIPEETCLDENPIYS